MANKAPAVFLDRDGTLNFDPGYLNDANRLELLPGVGVGLRKLKDAGFLLIVISNQSGVARGLISPQQLGEVHERLNELLAANEVKIDAFETCTHHPDDRCACRKPKPKLILEASAKHGIEVAESYFVGDRLSDLEAGTAAGCRAVVLVRTGQGLQTESSVSSDAYDFVADDFEAAARWIISDQAAQRVHGL